VATLMNELERNAILDQDVAYLLLAGTVLKMALDDYKMALSIAKKAQKGITSIRKTIAALLMECRKEKQAATYAMYINASKNMNVLIDKYTPALKEMQHIGGFFESEWGVMLVEFTKLESIIHNYKDILSEHKRMRKWKHYVPHSFERVTRHK